MYLVNTQGVVSDDESHCNVSLWAGGQRVHKAASMTWMGRREIGIITALRLPSLYLTPLYMTQAFPSILAYCMRVEVGVRLHDQTSKAMI